MAVDLSVPEKRATKERKAKNVLIYKHFDVRVNLHLIAVSTC